MGAVLDAINFDPSTTWFELVPEMPTYWTPEDPLIGAYGLVAGD